jgi:hypothetical protein
MDSLSKIFAVCICSRRNTTWSIIRGILSDWSIKVSERLEVQIHMRYETATRPNWFMLHYSHEY